MPKNRDGTYQFPDKIEPTQAEIVAHSARSKDAETERIANTFTATLLGFGQWLVSGVDDMNQMVVIETGEGTTLIQALGMVGAGEDE